ncbi:MAG: LytTR family transcriptional regulator DNA-binding domain-containing protein [Clostridia bacterium]|nr:LytTR family transcriptional regulator DNA-binding domain-containing protein [Clostridia bacterium]
MLILEADPSLRAAVVEQLKLVDTSSILRIVLASDSAEGIERQFSLMDGITMIILGLSLKYKNRTRGLDLGHKVMRANRDNYAVYLIHEAKDIESVLLSCDRPAGMLLAPFTRERIASCIGRVIEDYKSQNEAEGDAACLTVSSGTSTYRIPFDQITYIEALDKKLSIYTQRQTITLRATLGKLIEQLPPQFVRCHRSYVVNINYVSQTDYADMTLTLFDGDSLPISRSSRGELKAALDSIKETQA